METQIRELEKRLTEATGQRLRARAVDVGGAVRRAVNLAAATESPGELVTVVRHGGSVAAAYQYPAVTEAVAIAAVRWTDGPRDVICVLAQAGRLPARGATLAGAAGLVSEALRVLYDGRCGERQRVARARVTSQAILDGVRASGRAAASAEELPDGRYRAERSATCRHRRQLLAEKIADCEGEIAGREFRIAELFAEGSS